jgi:hypothetical protein
VVCDVELPVDVVVPVVPVVLVVPVVPVVPVVAVVPGVVPVVVPLAVPGLIPAAFVNASSRAVNSVLPPPWDELVVPLVGVPPSPSAGRRVGRDPPKRL